jgi:hypothetical protein
MSDHDNNQKDALDRFLESFNVHEDTLQDPEDMVAEDEIKFVGYYVLMQEALNEVYLRNTKSGAVFKSAVNLESTLERWIDSAKDFLPEWAYHLYP